METVTPDTPVELARKLLCGAQRVQLDAGWRTWPNVQQAYRDAMTRAAATMPGYPPNRYSGRGVVILGGGQYFASAYVTLRMIRHVGCKLPVEVWYLGSKREMLDWQACLLQNMGATCVDADAVAARRPVRILKGWELKIFAVLHSGFEQVRFEDADSYPCRDPNFLFDDPGFVEHGAMFFPDAPWMKLLPSVWEVMGIAHRDERTIESGQFFLDKRRCWRPLALTHWMNQRSDYYFQIGPRKSGQDGEYYGRGVHGDKDTFHLAWRYLGCEYAMPKPDYAWIPPAVVQHAPDGKPVFVHRARRKFSLEPTNFGTSRQDGPDFEPKLPMEREAHGFLEELRKIAKSNEEFSNG